MAAEHLDDSQPLLDSFADVFPDTPAAHSEYTAEEEAQGPLLSSALAGTHMKRRRVPVRGG